MTSSSPSTTPGPRASAGASEVVAAARALREALATCRLRPEERVENIDLITALEELKSAAEATQARASLAFDAGTWAWERTSGVPTHLIGTGVVSDLALGRHESPVAAAKHLGTGRILITEMPRTFAALQSGLIDVWRATIIARDTACLPREDRVAVDTELAADTGALTGYGPARIAAMTKKLAYAKAPRLFTERHQHAIKDRHISIQPAPDAMAWIKALLPLPQAIASYTTLTRHADTATQGQAAAPPAGAERGWLTEHRARHASATPPKTRGQTMADEFVSRLTGNPAGYTRIELQLVMTDRTLFAGDCEPAVLPGYQIFPAQIGRDLARTAPELSIRRLYTTPGTGDLIGMESRSRLFPPGLRRFIATRDQTCRTPYCDAPIRHRDHVTDWAHGGPTTAENGAGLCEHCNHAKNALNRSTKTASGPRHTIETTTSTGHTHANTAPSPPG